MRTNPTISSPSPPISTIVVEVDEEGSILTRRRRRFGLGGGGQVGIKKERFSLVGVRKVDDMLMMVDGTEKVMMMPLQ